MIAFARGAAQPGGGSGRAGTDKIGGMGALSLVLLLVLFPRPAMPAPDAASRWFRADAPHAYVVRQGESEPHAAAQFVRHENFWAKVWCPWPGYAPPVPIGAGDLLVRVRIEGRSWVQRVRRGGGDRPHARELDTYSDHGIKPFVFRPEPGTHPPLQLAMDVAQVAPSEPLREIDARVTGFWPRTDTRPAAVIRLDTGGRDFLQVGTALRVAPAGNGPGATDWLRAMVAAVLPQYSYAVLLEPAAQVAPGARVRSPLAWCTGR